MLTLPAAFALYALIVLGIAWIAPASPRLALGLATAQLALPALPEGSSLPRFVLALCALLAILRTIDLAGDSLSGTRHRVHHLTAVFDTRLARSVPRVVRSRLLAQTLPWLLACGAALWVGVLGRELSGTAYWAVRWGCGAVFAVSAVEVVARVVPFLWGLAGVEPPVLHDSPLLSTSVRDFWGCRWNKVVALWLRLNVYAPLRRGRSGGLALAATFAVSALFHWYLVAAALSIRLAWVMGAFFLVQAALMVVEDSLQVRRWPTAAARVWAIASILATSPLFLEPMVQLVEPPMFPGL